MAMINNANNSFIFIIIIISSSINSSISIISNISISL